MTHLQQAVKRSFNYIASQQQPNGCFLSDQGKSTTFYTSLILSNPAMEQTICQSGIAFLREETASSHQLNYWQKDSAEYSAVPYPNDVDDTFVAMQALQRCDASLLTEKALADLVLLLVHQETQPGGPYRTWITPSAKPAWQDVDIVANSNVATFMQSLGVELPYLQQYFDDELGAGVRSKYYHHSMTILYFLSKSYRGNNTEKIVSDILDMQNDHGNWDNALHTAFAISTLLRYNYPSNALGAAIQYLVSIEENGSWSSTDLYIESIANGIPLYSSCSAYVSVCCIEALLAYEKSLLSEHAIENTEPLFVTRVHEACLSNTHDPALQLQLSAALKALSYKDPTHEIALLPYNFATYCRTAEHDESIVLDLATANTLGWIGYGIYDSILDGEDKTAFLPLANMCIKRMIELFRSAASDTGYAIVQDILTGIDSSTLWEHAHCKSASEKLPDYGDYTVLAKKSLGHALGPILLVHDSSDQIPHIISFFTHYLIARQLNDDAHDWLEDLGNGWINSISVGMIQQLGSTDPSVLQEYFWDTHIERIAELIFSHTAKARLEAKKITVLSEVTFLEELLVPLEQSAHQALRERDRTKAFLEHLQY